MPSLPGIYIKFLIVCRLFGAHSLGANSLGANSLGAHSLGANSLDANSRVSDVQLLHPPLRAMCAAAKVLFWVRVRVKVSVRVRVRVRVRRSLTSLNTKAYSAVCAAAKTQA